MFLTTRIINSLLLFLHCSYSIQSNPYSTTLAQDKQQMGAHLSMMFEDTKCLTVIMYSHQSNTSWIRLLPQCKLFYQDSFHSPPWSNRNLGGITSAWTFRAAANALNWSWPESEALSDSQINVLSTFFLYLSGRLSLN